MTCLHEDIRPIPGDEDWGRCVACGDEGYPLTERAAYGDVAFSTCKDTGMVPVAMDGGFADARCSDCDRDSDMHAGAAAVGDPG